jgi:hypothetical protein
LQGCLVEHSGATMDSMLAATAAATAATWMACTLLVPAYAPGPVAAGFAATPASNSMQAVLQGC